MWQPFPVEYKRGQLRQEESFDVQLFAYALCLEEMLKAKVPEGAVFYGKTKRRLGVYFDDALRKKTEDTARRIHELIKSGITPKAEYSKKCENCSLLELCMPKTCGKTKSVSKYLLSAVEEE